MPTVPDPHRKTKYRHGKKWPDTLRSLPGQLALRERHRRRTYCCCGSPPLLYWCWTHVRAGLYLFALYVFRRRLLAWPGEGVGGAYSWTGNRFLRLSPPTSGLARIGRQGGAQLDAEFAFLRFSPPTSGLAWMGRWRGALPWHGACLSIFHSPASRREAKLCSVTGPNTI